jgi:L-arabinose transport system permease protein
MEANIIKKQKNILKNIWENAGMLFVFIFMFIVFSIFVPYFFTFENMTGLALSVSMVGMVSCTMLFCLASGDFDLSVEAVVAASGVICAVVIKETDNIFLGILSGILSGGIVGIVNGTIIAKFKINALITTLATMQIVRGIGFIVSKGSSVGISNDSFSILGTGTILNIPNPIWITLMIFIIFGILLNKTTFGRNTLAIGGNKEAARLAGINVNRIKIAIFTIQGLMSGFAGVVLASRLTSGQPNTSQGFALDCISACVLGGVSLAGGVGTMLGTVVGVLIMGMVRNVLNLLNVQTFYQYIVTGSILLAAVLFDQLKQRKSV